MISKKDQKILLQYIDVIQTYIEQPEDFFTMGRNRKQMIKNTLEKFKKEVNYLREE